MPICLEMSQELPHPDSCYVASVVIGGGMAESQTELTMRSTCLTCGRSGRASHHVYEPEMREQAAA
jgi:hypothetical protein